MLATSQRNIDQLYSNGSKSTDLTAEDGEEEDPHQLEPTRYERTSELIKGFKHACSRMREEFRSLEMELPEYTAVLDELTKNTYIMVIVHDPTIGRRTTRRSMQIANVVSETAAIKINIRLARSKFEELQADTII